MIVFRWTKLKTKPLSKLNRVWNCNCWNKHQLYCNLSEQTKTFLCNIILDTDKNRIKQDVYKSYNKESEEVKGDTKWKQMKGPSRSSNKVHYKLLKVVFNISTRQVFVSKESKLNKDLSCTTFIKWILYLDLMVLVEKVTL